jgi:hypothetical protein
VQGTPAELGERAGFVATGHRRQHVLDRVESRLERLWRVLPATAYGVSASARGDAGAYLTIKGLRDGVSGVVVFALLLTGAHHGLGIFLIAAALLPIGDAMIVLRHKGSRVLAYSVHGGTAVAMVAVGLQLLTQ